MHFANLFVIFIALVVTATPLKLDIPDDRRRNGHDKSDSRSFFRQFCFFTNFCLRNQLRRMRPGGVCGGRILIWLVMTMV